MRVSRLLSGDLLELEGTWTGDRELRARSITILTNEEDAGCRFRARRGETKDATAAREADEQRFLDGK